MWWSCTCRHCASGGRTFCRWPTSSSPSSTNGRARFSASVGDMPRALSLAGQRARAAQRHGARGPAFARRTDSCQSTCPTRVRPTRRTTAAGRGRATPSDWRKSSARRFSRHCASIDSIAPKPPRPSASAAALSSTNCNASASRASKLIPPEIPAEDLPADHADHTDGKFSSA